MELTQALLFLCVCVQDVSFKFLPSLHAEFVLIPCPLLSFACFTQHSAMQICGKKLTSFCCVWMDFALEWTWRDSRHLHGQIVCTNKVCYTK